MSIYEKRSRKYENTNAIETVLGISAKCASIIRALTILKLLFIYHFVPETSCQNWESPLPKSGKYGQIYENIIFV